MLARTALRTARSAGAAARNAASKTTSVRLPVIPSSPQLPASLNEFISKMQLSLPASIESIDLIADELGGTARGLDIQLNSRGYGFVLEDECPPHRCHRLRYRIGCVVLPPLRTKRGCHDPSRRGVSDIPIQMANEGIIGGGSTS